MEHRGNYPAFYYTRHNFRGRQGGGCCLPARVLSPANCGIAIVPSFQRTNSARLCSCVSCCQENGVRNHLSKGYCQIVFCEFAEPHYLLKKSTMSQNHLRPGSVMPCVVNTGKGIFSQVEFDFDFDFDFDYDILNFVNTRSKPHTTKLKFRK